jgi:hypothetical protein
MKNYSKQLVATTLLLAVGIFAARVEAQVQNTVIQWNQLAGQLVAGPPFSQLRQYAMIHVAMADAVVAIEGRYEAFKVDEQAPRGASASAAAAQAAHDVLFTFFDPSTTAGAAARAAIAAKLAADLATVPPGQRALGVEVGHKIAAAVLVWRATDGFAAANPQPPLPAPIAPSALPGIWIITMPGGPAQFSKMGDVEPFGVLSPTQFLADPMPQLESAEYAADFNEVKDEGERPAPYPTSCDDPSIEGRQRIALVWATTAPCGSVTTAFRVWHNVARDMAQAERLSLVETARLFALLTTSQFDSVQTSQTAKFVYRLWRPETAIANAGAVGSDPDYDDNPLTEGQPGWVPLLVTPPYPSHSSNMQCIGAGGAETLRNFFGDSRPFKATWYLNNTATSPVVRAENYTSFSDLEVEEGLGRVWGGIHFKFELTESIESCNAVADYIFEHKMQPAT